MTIREMQASKECFLNPTDVAPILGCDPQSIRLQARKDPASLGFPVVVLGTRTRIPRKAFLEYLGEKDS